MDWLAEREPPLEAWDGGAVIKLQYCTVVSYSSFLQYSSIIIISWIIWRDKLSSWDLRALDYQSTELNAQVGAGKKRQWSKACSTQQDSQQHHILLHVAMKSICSKADSDCLSCVAVHEPHCWLTASCWEPELEEKSVRHPRQTSVFFNHFEEEVARYFFNTWVMLGRCLVTLGWYSGDTWMILGWHLDDTQVTFGDTWWHLVISKVNYPITE